jgi:hypothetical protein
MPAVRPDAVSQAPTPARTVIASSSEIIGSLTGGNLYTNPALGISLQLTGEWEFMDNPTLRMAEGLPPEETNKAQPKSQCTAPVCGEPDINVGLSTELNPTIGASSVFVTGFKLAPQYLDRKQYPLRMFAEIMLPHSSGQNAQESLSDIQLGGRPAYRLLVRQPGEDRPREAGYVVESNGYIVLLVGSTSEAADLLKLQQQIEAAKLR